MSNATFRLAIHMQSFTGILPSIAIAIAVVGVLRIAVAQVHSRPHVGHPYAGERSLHPGSSVALSKKSERTSCGVR
jgi:hypothetical protein